MVSQDNLSSQAIYIIKLIHIFSFFLFAQVVFFRLIV